MTENFDAIRNPPSHRGFRQDPRADDAPGAAGGLGGVWARYRTSIEGLGEPFGPDAVDLRQLGIVEGRSGLRFVRVPSLDQLETRHDVTLDAHGNLGVVEREPDCRPVRVLLDTYLLGDTRLSSAAGQALEEACRNHG